MTQNFRRFLAVFLSVILLCGILPPTGSAALRFTDVPAGAWYYKAVEDLVNRGIMNGKTSTAFAPGDTLTRAEFVTILARTTLSESALAQYNYKGPFSDVSPTNWANRYINWASEAQIVSGTGNGRFSPDSRLSRQDMAVMVVNFASTTGMELRQTNGPQLFLDYRSIADYAATSVTLCQRAGIINGYDDLTFRPKGYAKRSEAAQMYSNFLKVAVSSGCQIIRKKLNGIPVDAVVFDPSRYTAGVALGNNQVRGRESATSIVSRTGAIIAVNAAFFDMSSYTPYGTMINNGQLLTTFNLYSPAKSAITMDSRGRFSVENFTTKITLSAPNPKGVTCSISNVAVNVLPSAIDSSRIIFTSEWGSTLGFAPKFAAVVNGSGTVTAVYRNQNKDVSIPKSGYVIAQRTDNKWDDSFWTAMTVGNTVNRQIDYVGSSTQDIKLTIGVGPKIVSGGRAYGNDSTYKAEGLLNINNYGNAERVCIGVKYDGSLVILHANTSLPELSKIMVAMGCESAVNLDGGGSANLYVNGQWLVGPGSRLLNNMLYFK